MEIYLEKLGLSSLPDLKSIKKAYAAKLKTIDQSNIKEFEEVREAYLVLCGKSAPTHPDAEDISIDRKNYYEPIEEEVPRQSVFNGLIEALFLENENKDFSAADWINSQPALDSLQVRAEFSAILLQEFFARTHPWSYEIMREVSVALNWHEISSGLPNQARMLVDFEIFLERIDFHRQVISLIEEFFTFHWQDQESAFMALLRMRDDINYDLNLLSEFFLNKTIQCCSSAPIAALAANTFFGWKNLNVAQERSLEIALTEAKFREKVCLVKNYQAPPPDEEGYAIWHLMQPFDYRGAINYLALSSIDSVISVINKIDEYNINFDLNNDQIKFYSEYYRAGSEHPIQRAVKRKKHFRKIVTAIVLIGFVAAYFCAKHIAEPLSKVIGS